MGQNCADAECFLSGCLQFGSGTVLKVPADGESGEVLGASEIETPVPHCEPHTAMATAVCTRPAAG